MNIECIDVCALLSNLIDTMPPAQTMDTTDRADLLDAKTITLTIMQTNTNMKFKCVRGVGLSPRSELDVPAAHCNVDHIGAIVCTTHNT